MLKVAGRGRPTIQVALLEKGLGSSSDREYLVLARAVTVLEFDQSSDLVLDDPSDDEHHFAEHKKVREYLDQIIALRPAVSGIDSRLGAMASEREAKPDGKSRPDDP